MSTSRLPLNSRKRNAAQKHVAIKAVMINLRGETSNDVSDTRVPNAKQLKAMANMRSGIGPQIRRRIRVRVWSS
jgi:hypothetical protein